MAQSWSGLRRELESDFLCESLKGRVQYFLTHYHKAPDKLGRVCVRVDGVEVVHGNPYDFYVKGYKSTEYRLKNELGIPDRDFINGEDPYDEENSEIEDRVIEMAHNDGVFEIYDFTDAIYEYKNSNIQDSLKSDNGLIRMLAVMDRRVGKRTLTKLANDIESQPEWLKFFYKLRLEAERII